MNERQQSHSTTTFSASSTGRDAGPASSTARLLAARDADESHPLRTEEEATEVVNHLRRLELGQSTEEGRPR